MGRETKATIPVPVALLQEILGYGPCGEPRVLGAITSTSVFSADEIDGYDTEDGPTVRITIPQFGQLLAWAFEDADDGWFESEATKLEEVLDCRTGAADRARNLVLFMLRHMPKAWASQPRPMSHSQWLQDLKRVMTRMPEDL